MEMIMYPVNQYNEPCTSLTSSGAKPPPMQIGAIENPVYAILNSPLSGLNIGNSFQFQQVPVVQQ